MSKVRSAQIWTSDRTPLVLPLAGVGERGLAYLIDVSLLLFAAGTAIFVYSQVGDVVADWAALPIVLQVLLVACAILVFLSYDILFERLMDGQSPGKKIMRLRVIRSDGTRPDLITTLIRNLSRAVDYLPGGYGAGVITLLLTGSKRVGDILADTFVVSERARRDDRLEAALSFADAEQAKRAPTWSDAEVHKAIATLYGAKAYAPALREKLSQRTLKSIDPTRHEDNATAALANGLFALQKVPGSVVARAKKMNEAQARLELAFGTAKAERSFDNAATLDDAQKRACGELMRAVRKDEQSATVQSLSLRVLDVERYRRGKDKSSGVLHYFARTIPQSVYAERQQVFRAAAIFAVFLFIGFSLAQIDPQFARYFIGPELSERIEAGANWTNDIEENRSFARAAMMIIFNNVRIAFIAFILGALGAVPTLIIVAANGISIGSMFGYASAMGTGAVLNRFVLAHGPVELSAICVAAAGGMCLGRALISPGERTRIDALREEAQVGVRLAIFAGVALLLIGMVEGFVSPGQYFPASFNAALGITLWLLFFSWVFFLGRPKKAI